MNIVEVIAKKPRTFSARTFSGGLRNVRAFIEGGLRALDHVGPEVGSRLGRLIELGRGLPPSPALKAKDIALAVSPDDLRATQKVLIDLHVWGVTLVELTNCALIEIGDVLTEIEGVGTTTATGRVVVSAERELLTARASQRATRVLQTLALEDDDLVPPGFGQTAPSPL